jgi:hypothetical protein
MTIARTQMNRQLYQMGGMGMESLSPMQPAMQSAMYNPLEENYYSGMPMMMAGGGIANLVPREKYGIGSKLKKFVRNIIPNEISEIAVKAAPFVAPFNPALAAAMSGIGGFDQTGRIGSSLKNAALVYGAGQLARGIGGAGFQGNPFAGVDFSGGFTSGIGSLFSSPMGNLPFGSFSTPTTTPVTSITPTQNLIQTSPGYTGGVDLAPSELTGRTAEELQKGQLLQSAKELETGMGRSQAELIKTYGTQPGTEPGYIDLIKKAGSFENVPLSERFNAIKDLSTKAITDIYTKPIPGQPGKTQLDKNALFSTFAGASSYYEALQLAKKAGIPESEFSEADYQRLKVDPEKAKFASLKAENFGIKKAEGGRIGYGIGDLVRSSGIAQPVSGGDTSGGGFGMGLMSKLIQQNPQMFKAQMTSSRRDFIDNDNNGIDDREEAAGGGLMNEGVLSIKLTPAQQMAMGGRIGYQVGGTIDPFGLQRSPIDLYGYSDPVIAALTGNVFTSGQRFRDVFSPQAGLMMQQAQAAGYSEPEMEELRQQHDFFPSFQRSLNEAYFGPTFQADPQKSAIDLANYIYNQRFQTPPSVQQQQQRQPVQYQYSDRGTMIDQFGYQPGQLTPELQSQIDQYKRALNRVESSYGKKFSEISGPEQMTNPGAYGQTGGMPFTANQYLSKAYQSEQDAAARVTPKMAKGGKINYPMGSEIPVRQNQGGISELDLRAKGGYIPVGIKEKADDVPAMLSKNEFVFTADAVRGAGNGNINKGAQKMYKLMKSLEKKVKKMKKVA